MRRRIVSISKFTLASLLLSLLPQTGCHQNALPPELVDPECAEQKRGWTTEELADIAFKAATGQVDRKEATVRIWQRGCEITVSVTWDLRYAGNHFSVYVSAIDGTVLDMLPGE